MTPESHYNLGVVRHGQGDVAGALECFSAAVRLRPAFPQAQYNLGTLLKDIGRLDEAIAALRIAVQLRPNHPGGWNNLGNAYMEQGRLPEARQCLQKAIALAPDLQQAQDNLLMLLYYDATISPATILDEHRRWARRFADPLTANAPPHVNDRDPDRRLRIGYVSPRFRESAESFFLVPLLETHDRTRFETYCYSDVAKEDDVTAQMARSASVWRRSVRMTDQQLAGQIREDRIDILIDLMSHGGGNRLLAFARKPAPVQITYLGYPGTTGMTAMDYRLSDRYLDPPGRHDGQYSEQTIRLPGCYWCYQPPATAPEVKSLPALARGELTLGCLNRFDKVSPQCLELWGQVMQVLPNARLLLYADPGGGRDRVIQTMRSHGIDPARINFVGRQPFAQYLATYQQIDIALDTYPCCGATTTCHALWMGVPVVSAIGPTVMGRGGASILSTVGLSDLVATALKEYIQILQRLSADLDALNTLRQQMRQRMKASVLLDFRTFTRGLEEVLRTLWSRWCR